MIVKFIIFRLLYFFVLIDGNLFSFVKSKKYLKEKEALLL